MYKRIVSLFLALIIFSYYPNVLLPPPPLSCGTLTHETPTQNNYLPIVQAREEVQPMAENTDLWWIVVPETTTNLITNPSIENATTGYSAVGASVLVRSVTYQRRGNYSLRVTPTAALSDGAKYSLTLAAATWYTFSFDIKGVDGVSYNFDIYDSVAATILGAPVTFTSDGGWARYAVTAQTGANTAIQVRVYKYSNASVAAFYLDGFQVEAKQYATDYCDGDIDGCAWTAGKHTSTSSRQAQFSGAGRPVSLYDYDYQVGPVTGAGMSAVEITVKRPAVQDGAVFRKQSIRERVMQVDGVFNESDLIAYHATRGSVLRLLNPNRFATQQPVHLRYTGSGKMLDAPFYYQGGMDGNCLGCPNEQIPLRLYATDPYWTEFLRIFTAADIAAGIGTGAAGTAGSAGENGGGGGNTALAATSTLSIAGVNYIIQKNADGNWSKINDGLTITPSGGTDDVVARLTVNSAGELYLSGVFANVDTALNYEYFTKWNGAWWEDLGAPTIIPFDMVTVPSTGNIYIVGAGAGQEIQLYQRGVGFSNIGNADNQVNVIALSPDESMLYVAGPFTSINGVAATNLAKYTIATTTWAAAGNPDSTVYALEFNPAGTILYAGGAFANIGGVAATRIAKCTVGTGVWSTIGTGADNQVIALAVTPDGTALFAGGVFHTMNGVAALHIAKYTIATTTWTAMGGGTDDDINTLDITPDSLTLFVGGAFHTAGGIAALHIAKFNISTSAWETLGNGLDDFVNDLIVDNRGRLIAVGAFHNSGAIPLNHIGIWNGIIWQDLFIPARDILQASDGKIYVAGGFTDVDSVANTAKIAYWDTNLGTWNALGTGADDGVVYALAELANGDIVAAGYFTGMGGVANTQSIAVWDISAGAWTSIGDINGSIFDIAIAPNGDIYIGGLFLDADSVANTKNLAYYDISAATWAAVSDEPDGVVNTLKFAATGKLYIGGAFAHIGAADYDYISLYDPTTDTFSVLENGTNGYVNSIDITPNGCVYMTGTFTTAGTVTDVNYVAAWNGTQFQPLGTGLNNQGYIIKTDAAGLVYIGGAFTEAGGVTLPDKVTVWNGTNFKPIDVDLPGTAVVEAMLFAPTITIIGFDTSGTAVTSYVN